MEATIPMTLISCNREWNNSKLEKHSDTKLSVGDEIYCQRKLVEKKKKRNIPASENHPYPKSFLSENRLLHHRSVLQHNLLAGYHHAHHAADLVRVVYPLMIDSLLDDDLTGSDNLLLAAV
jgi:hypothetical protein